jgi:hypothetical protein
VYIELEQIAAQDVIVCVEAFNLDSTWRFELRHEANLEHVGHCHVRFELFYVSLELAVLLLNVDVQIAVRVVV